MSSDNWVLEGLGRAGAVLLDRHFIYASGKHGPGYINMDPVFPDVEWLYLVCQGMVKPFIDGGIDVVVGPATGGIPLATFGALYASKGRSVRAVWADKDGKEFAFERAGFAGELAGKRVLVVEDLLTTGGSVLKVCREAEKHGANIVGVSVIVNRGGVTAEQLEVPRLEALAAVNFDAIDADDCPLCASGVPIIEDIGHGAEYKDAHPDYKGGYVKAQAA